MTHESVNSPIAIPANLRTGMGRVLVLGGGFSGQVFGRCLARLGVPVTLTWREVPPSVGEESDNLHWIRFDPANGHLPCGEDLLGTTHVLVTIPPDRAGRDPVLTHLAAELQSLPLVWVGYLSTTGVYGDHGGQWVHEESVLQTTLGRSRARVICEQAWLQSGFPVQV